jgi:hypothetical protein
MSKENKIFFNILYWILASVGAFLILEGTNAITMWGVLLLLLAVRLITYIEQKEKEGEK